MKLTESSIEGVPLIVVEGDLDQASKRGAHRAVDDALRGPYSTGSLFIDLTNCAFVASVAQPSNGVAPQGTATVAGRAGNPLGVFVQTFDLTGAQVDRPFHLIVYC